MIKNSNVSVEVIIYIKKRLLINLNRLQR